MRSTIIALLVVSSGALTPDIAQRVGEATLLKDEGKEEVHQDKPAFEIVPESSFPHNLGLLSKRGRLSKTMLSKPATPEWKPSSKDWSYLAMPRWRPHAHGTQHPKDY